MPGERRELARVRGLVEREQDDGEVALVAEAVEQRFQRVHVVGARRDVGAHVAAEARIEQRIVVAERARMDLHHQTVIEAHAGHLGEHLRAEELGIALARLAGDDLQEQPLGVGLRQVHGLCRTMAVVGRGRAVLLEEGAPVAVRLEVAAPGVRVAAREMAEFREIVGKAVEFRIDNRVRPVGGDDAALPA